jgi:curved DNA-binding protein
MQNFRNYYSILGVSKESTPEQIKTAYRQLARTYHPDMNPGDQSAEDKFKDIGEAYEILSEPTKRAQYDKYSSYWKKDGFQGARGTWSKVWGRSPQPPEDMDYASFRDFNSFVDQLRNRRQTEATPESRPRTSEPRPRSNPPRPEPTQTYSSPAPKSPKSPKPPKNAYAELTVPLERAYTGGRERIRLEDGRSLEVNMPGGMFTGQKIRLRGQGVEGGDLYMTIEVPPHPFFRLEGADIACQIPVTPTEAVLGGPIEVPTLDGLVKMMIPAGVQSGQKLRLGGKGYPVEGDRGDQIVEIQIVTPKDISPAERDLYEKLRQLESFNPRDRLV